MWEWEEIVVARALRGGRRRTRRNALVAARLRCRCRLLSGAGGVASPFNFPHAFLKDSHVLKKKLTAVR